MPAPQQNIPPDWRADYSYLLVMARMQMPHKLLPKVSASDVVQETLTKAYEKRDRFRGQSDGEWRAWLRKILANGLADHGRRFGGAERNANLEVSLQARIDASSVRIERFIAADQSTPSARVERTEQLLQLTEALEALPDDQRTAVKLKHLDGLTVEQIAQAMQRSREAVGGLLRRGMRALRDSFACSTGAADAHE
jgi:RNA polymerase sigma-70 factor, ECF subfamily